MILRKQNKTKRKDMYNYTTAISQYSFGYTCGHSNHAIIHASKEKNHSHTVAYNIPKPQKTQKHRP